jgi:phosphoribosyl 1,2-cyclic phosphodiesterase
MAFSFCVLGSGSLGNCTAMVHGDHDGRRCALVDCGFSPRATRRRLAPLGLDLHDVDEVFLTHVDADHFHRGWVKMIRKLDIAVHVHRRHRARAVWAGLDGHHLRLFDEAMTPESALRCETVLLPHDNLGSVGYVFEHGGARLGYATDFGRVTRTLLEAFVDLDALAIESNYDRDRQVWSDRPEFLKERIMGGLGHLSNEQALDAVLEIAGRSALEHVVALHLSRDCNDDRLVTDGFARRSPALLDRLTVSSQERATPMLALASPGPPRRGEQLVLPITVSRPHDRAGRGAPT